MHKVMTDVNGYRVRMEEYIFRPSTNTIVCLNLCLRTDGASALKGITSLELRVEFAQNILDGLSYQQIKDVLDWDKYFGYGSPIPYGSTPAYYPTEVEATFRNPLSQTCALLRSYGSLSGSPPNVTQPYGDYFKVGDGSFSSFSTYPDFSGNPCQFSFDYIETKLATLKVYEITENGQKTSTSLSISNIFHDFLCTGDFGTVGRFYEIQIWTGDHMPDYDPVEFDLIYMPPGDVPATN
jgi:hypothetical protein